MSAPALFLQFYPVSDRWRRQYVDGSNEHPGSLLNILEQLDRPLVTMTRYPSLYLSSLLKSLAVWYSKLKSVFLTSKFVLKSDLGRNALHKWDLRKNVTLS